MLSGALTYSCKSNKLPVPVPFKPKWVFILNNSKEETENWLQCQCTTKHLRDWIDQKGYQQRKISISCSLNQQRDLKFAEDMVLSDFKGSYGSLDKFLLKWKKSIKCGLLRYIGYRNFINDLIKHVSLLILVHVRLLFCPNCSLHALLLLKKHWIRYERTMILFTKGTELTIFGQLKIPKMFSINLNLKTFRLLNCLHMIFYTVYYVTSSSYKR